MKDAIILVLYICLLGASYFLARWGGREQIRDEAIEKGFAEYDNKTGKFKWIEVKK